MSDNSSEVYHQLDKVTRRERSRLIAHLVQRLGGQHLQLAEDVAQEAVLAALSNWPYHGLPDNPAAWLTRVAGNKAIDYLRRHRREVDYQAELDQRIIDDCGDHYQSYGVSCGDSLDPDIELMLLCCHPELPAVEQLALTLRTTCGFTARELATILLCTESAIAQRLARAKRKLKQLDEKVLLANKAVDIQQALAAIHKVIYLLFSLGYAPRYGDQLIREDTAMEAVRLAQALADHPRTNNPTTHALAALLYFQASRLAAREDAQGLPILLPHQDRRRWNREFIQRGFLHLQRAQASDTISRYHIEAGIASLYASSKNWQGIDWLAIGKLYAQLQTLTQSPVVTINASVAKALAGDAHCALHMLERIAVSEFIGRYAPYYIAKAEILQRLGRCDEASENFSRAIACGASRPVIEHLETRIANLL